MNHLGRRCCPVLIAAVLACLCLASSPAQAKTTVHLGWTGYRGVSLHDTLKSAAHRLRAPIRNHCGIYKSVATYHNELGFDSEFGPNKNRVSQMWLVAPGITSLHAAMGPRGVRMGSTFKAAKKAWGKKLHTFKNDDGSVYYYGRGPGKKILFFGLGSVDIAGTIRNHRVFLINITPDIHLARQEMSNEGGC